MKARKQSRKRLKLKEAERDKRRLRYGLLPVPSETVEVPYAKRHDDDFDAGEVVGWLVDRPEWQDTIGAECALVESERPRKGPKPSYTTIELEAALFFQIISGIRTYKAARDRLAGDKAERSRAALRFDQPRESRCSSERTCFAGIPSEATMSRHRARFPHERRLKAYMRYFDRLRQVNAQDPQLRAGLRLLGVDGSVQLTSLTCPKLDVDTGEVLNHSSITCMDGGYVGKGVPAHKQGHGYAVVPIVSLDDGLPWSYHHGRISDNESTAALAALEDFKAKVLPYAGPRRLGVFAADSGFNSRELRTNVRDVGYLDCIHEVSHALGRESTDREYTRAEKRVFEIEGHPNWYADGFRELHCKCGKGKAERFRRMELRGERAVGRVEGRCNNCGSITVTSGKWKTVRDTTRETGDERGSNRLARVQPADPPKVIDWAFGSPLSFHDKLAEKYGSLRFGHGEGFNGSAVKRFKLLKTKGYYRTGPQAELHCLMVFCAMHGMTMRKREQERGAAPVAPAAPAAVAA